MLAPRQQKIMGFEQALAVDASVVAIRCREDEGAAREGGIS